jgi:betaine-aldehyde dehydrogenase
MQKIKHYINGNFCATEDNIKEIYNPATQKCIAIMPIASEKEVLYAIDSANNAFDTWSKTPSIKRSEYLTKIAESINSKKDRIAKEISLCMGKPIKEAYLDVEDAIGCYTYYADLANNIDKKNELSFQLPDSQYTIYKRLEPVGAVGLIVPWNFPLVTTSWKLAPALAAGCTVVLKPSQISPTPEQILCEILEEINLPKGVVNITFGSVSVGEIIIKSEKLTKISFTGSTRIGQKIMVNNAATLKNLSLELGGKSSLIICEDVDIDKAAQLACNGIFFNNGQMCSATSRLLVHKSVYQEVLKSLKKKVESLNIGDPLLLDTDIGPLSSKMQLDTVLAYFEKARNENLSCLTGGKVISGNFVTPTVYFDVPKSSILWKEEIFGPILCVSSFEKEDEAIAMANDSEFGLAGSVISNDKKQAIRIANSLKAGIIWVNIGQIVLPQLSWGGYKQSSIGRELGESGLESFMELKHVISE